MSAVRHAREGARRYGALLARPGERRPLPSLEQPAALRERFRAFLAAL